MFRTLILTLSLCISINVFGWGNLGHSTTAQIADNHLTPQGKAFVQSILGAEPMAIAAIFPDLVRDDARYKPFAPYHFADIPEGFKTYEEKQKEAKWYEAKDSVTILTQAPVELLNPKRSIFEKATLLRYLIHVVGDVHQPLHIGNGYDMGANKCYVMWPNRETKKLDRKNLHSVWDDMLFHYMEDIYRSKPENRAYFSYNVVANLVAPLEKTVDVKKVQQASIDEWFEEARALHKDAYLDRPGANTAATRFYCDAEGRKASDLPTITKEYQEKSVKIIQSQLLKGGLRLAAILNKIGANTPVPAKDQALQILDSVLLKNAPR